MMLYRAVKLKNSRKRGPTAGLVEVTFYLKDQDMPYLTETVWAEALGGNRYRLRNVPYLVRGFSEQDVVTAIEVDGQLKVIGEATSSGHSAYRIYLRKDDAGADFSSAWLPLKTLGCSYERATNRLIAVDVPPNADIFAVHRVLQEGEESGKWTFEEGNNGHLCNE